jgi:glutathione synthase/RimK-type ligase-like ATP-grasp enzyme
MKRVLFAPYNIGSRGATDLSRAIGALRTKATKRLKRDVVLCNWGRSDLVVRGNPYKVLNPSHRVITATDKLKCLNRLAESGVSRVEHTTSQDTVRRWLLEGHVVYGRQLLNASQGKGIILLKPEDNQAIPYCPMYTKGIPKSHEYRVHVFNNQILDVTKKRRRNTVDRSDYIKNLANGWVYCREGIEVPENLLQCARAAVVALGLDFGAVDLLYRQGQPYVLEINTAPGLQGTTLTKYIQAFSQLKRLG